MYFKKNKHVPNHQPVMGYRQPRKSRLSHAYASPIVTAISQKSRCISLGAIYKYDSYISYHGHYRYYNVS